MEISTFVVFGHFKLDFNYDSEYLRKFNENTRILVVIKRTDLRQILVV